MLTHDHMLVYLAYMTSLFTANTDVSAPFVVKYSNGSDNPPEPPYIKMLRRPGEGDKTHTDADLSVGYLINSSTLESDGSLALFVCGGSPAAAGWNDIKDFVSIFPKGSMAHFEDIDCNVVSDEFDLYKSGISDGTVVTAPSDMIQSILSTHGEGIYYLVLPVWGPNNIGVGNHYPNHSSEGTCTKNLFAKTLQSSSKVKGACDIVRFNVPSNTIMSTATFTQSSFNLLGEIEQSNGYKYGVTLPDITFQSIRTVTVNESKSIKAGDQIEIKATPVVSFTIKEGDNYTKADGSIGTFSKTESTALKAGDTITISDDGVTRSIKISANDILTKASDHSENRFSSSATIDVLADDTFAKNFITYAVVSDGDSITTTSGTKRVIRKDINVTVNVGDKIEVRTAPRLTNMLDGNGISHIGTIKADGAWSIQTVNEGPYGWMRSCINLVTVEDIDFGMYENSDQSTVTTSTGEARNSFKEFCGNCEKMLYFNKYPELKYARNTDRMFVNCRSLEYVGFRSLPDNPELVIDLSDAKSLSEATLKNLVECTTPKDGSTPTAGSKCSLKFSANVMNEEHYKTLYYKDSLTGEYKPVLFNKDVDPYDVHNVMYYKDNTGNWVSVKKESDEEEGEVRAIRPNPGGSYYETIGGTPADWDHPFSYYAAKIVANGYPIVDYVI